MGLTVPRRMGGVIQDRQEKLYSPEELNQQENQRAWGSPLEIKATVLCQIRTPAILPFVQADFSFGFGSAEPKIN